MGSKSTVKQQRTVKRTAKNTAKRTRSVRTSDRFKISAALTVLSAIAYLAGSPLFAGACAFGLAAYFINRAIDSWMAGGSK
jgi:hypothetical protein